VRQAWDAPSPFVADAASLPTGSTEGPALTIMAVTARACDCIARAHASGDGGAAAHRQGHAHRPGARERRADPARAGRGALRSRPLPLVPGTADGPARRPGAGVRGREEEEP